MNLSSMVDLIYGQLGAKYQLTKARILQMISDVQMNAFRKDLEAFLRFDHIITLIPDPTDSSLMSKGPYSLPADCRNLFGIADSSTVDVADGLDFPLEKGRYDTLARTWTFSDYPAADVSYCAVYYRRPEELTSVNDDAKILIPPENIDSVLVQGALLLCDRDLCGDRPMIELYRTILTPFWDEMGNREAKTGVVLSEGAWQ